jgi:hypothetical protein
MKEKLMRKVKAKPLPDKEQTIRDMVHSIFAGNNVPIESVGECLNAARRNKQKITGCKNWNVVLGDGLCVQCWDIKASAKATLEDVHEEAWRTKRQLTEDEAKEVLRLAKKAPDASVDINGEVLDVWIDYVISNRSVQERVEVNYAKA